MLRWAQGLPTTMSLFFNVIFIFAILLALNYGISLYSPRLALTQGELLTFYTMLSVATAIAGADFFAVIITHIAGGGWLATEENEWATLFHRYFPDWLALTDKNSLTTYFVGESTLYLDEHLRLWWKPVLSWSGFIVVLVCTAFCINVIMRKQWIEIERLSYPIIELPQQMATRGFFRNRLMWAGAILAGGMDIINALHFLYPSPGSVAISSICAPILLRNRGTLSVGHLSRSSPLPLGWHILCRSISPSRSGFSISSGNLK